MVTENRPQVSISKNKGSGISWWLCSCLRILEIQYGKYLEQLRIEFLWVWGSSQNNSFCSFCYILYSSPVFSPPTWDRMFLNRRYFLFYSISDVIRKYLGQIKLCWKSSPEEEMLQICCQHSLKPHDFVLREHVLPFWTSCNKS